MGKSTSRLSKRAQRADIERVTTYKYLGFLIEQNLSFKLNTENVVSKQKIKLGFFYRNKCCKPAPKELV